MSPLSSINVYFCFVTLFYSYGIDSYLAIIYFLGFPQTNLGSVFLDPICLYVNFTTQGIKKW